MDQRHWSLNQCQGSWDEHHCLTVVAQRKIVSVELLWWHSEILQLLSHARWTQCKCLGVDCIWFWPLVTIMKHFSQSVSHTFVLQGTCEPHATPFLVLYLLKLPGDSEVVLGCDCLCSRWIQALHPAHMCVTMFLRLLCETSEMTKCKVGLLDFFTPHLQLNDFWVF